METLLVLLLVWPGLTTRLVPGPATISLDGGYRDILVTIQPHICREGRGQKACARQTLGNLKVLNTCYLRDDNFPGTVVTHHITQHTHSLIMFGYRQTISPISYFISPTLWLSLN